MQLPSEHVNPEILAESSIKPIAAFRLIANRKWGFTSEDITIITEPYTLSESLKTADYLNVRCHICFHIRSPCNAVSLLTH